MTFLTGTPDALCVIVRHFCIRLNQTRALQPQRRTPQTSEGPTQQTSDSTRTLAWPTQQASELALEGPQHECRYRWRWSWHWRGPNLALEVAVEVLSLNWNSVAVELALEGPTQQASELGLEVAVEVLSLSPALAAMYWPGDS